jgi:hypothetical protein
MPQRQFLSSFIEQFLKRSSFCLEFPLEMTDANREFRGDRIDFRKFSLEMLCDRSVES